MVAQLSRSAVRRDRNPINYGSDVSPVAQRRSLPANQRSGTNNRQRAMRLVETDGVYEDPFDDSLNNRSYRQPRPDLRAVPTNQSRTSVQTAKRHTFKLWICIGAILGLLAGCLLLQISSFAIGWGTDAVNTFRYGPTRTSLVSGVFGHNNDSPVHPTSVIAINLNGTLLLEEVPAGDMSKTRVYPTTFTLVGGDVTKLPVTLSISQTNNHLPNVLIQVSGQSVSFTLINNGTDFTLSSS